MFRSKLIVSTAFLGVVACIALACGNTRKIQSITVAPASADAHDYPDGKVPFVATGFYNVAPMSVTPLQTGGWGAAKVNQVIGPPTTDVSIDASGIAQCTSSASGTYKVAAWVNVPGNGPQTTCPATPYGDSCSSVVGTAQLTCP